MTFLLRFQSSLKALETYQKNLMVLTPSCQDIKDTVEHIMIFGYVLHSLTEGAALPMHLKNIAPLLRSLNLGNKVAMSTPAPDEEQEEPDKELKAVQPFIQVDGIETPLWQSYLDWFWLMVAHFDAADILITYVKGPSFICHTISIQVLVAPPVDQHLLTLKELLTNPTLFPTMTSTPESQANITNTKILKFLNKGFLSSSLVKGIKKWWNRPTSPTKKDSNKIRSGLVKLKSSCWSEPAMRLLERFEKLVIPPSLESEEFSQITEDINSLWVSCMFFASLDAALRKFMGMLHCKACLASLLDETATFSRDILAQMKVGCITNLFLSLESHIFQKGFGPIIGISKLCCPVCHHLLSCLFTGGEPFIVRGHHNTIMGCTLPPWLPDHIVNSMNIHFGDQLRWELVEFLHHSDLFQNHAQSTGSHRLSSNSSEPAHYV